MPVDPAALEHFLSWDGTVGRSFLRRIEAFEDLVRINAPIRAESPPPHLADTIGHTTSGAGGTELIAEIGTNPSQHVRGYAVIVHGGSKPHEILPIPPHKSLKFRVAGRVIYARRVFHPGTEPDPFLTRWIKELM